MGFRADMCCINVCFHSFLGKHGTLPVSLTNKRWRKELCQLGHRTWRLQGAGRICRGKRCHVGCKTSFNRKTVAQTSRILKQDHAICIRESLHTSQVAPSLLLGQEERKCGAFHSVAPELFSDSPVAYLQWSPAQETCVLLPNSKHWLSITALSFPGKSPRDWSHWPLPMITLQPTAKPYYHPSPSIWWLRAQALVPGWPLPGELGREQVLVWEPHLGNSSQATLDRYAKLQGPISSPPLCLPPPKQPHDYSAVGLNSKDENWGEDLTDSHFNFKLFVDIY